MYEELVEKLREKEHTLGETFHLFYEAADAIEELSKRLDESIPKGDAEIIIAEVAKPRWIPVTERLPEEDAICILTNGVSNAFGYRGKVFGWHLIWTDYLAESEVTHWMPLPEPPKEWSDGVEE